MFGTDNKQYQPVQLYHLMQEGFSCELFPPAEKLRAVIYYYWKLTIEAESVSLPVVPDSALDLVLSPTIPDFAALYSPKSQPFNIPLEGPVTYVGICFRVEKASHFFSLPLEKLNTLEASLGVIEVLQLHDLTRDIQGEHDNARLATALDKFWESYQPRKNENDHCNLLANVFDVLEVGAVSSMAEQVGLSERQFRRVSKGLFGLNPKQIHRILRLQEALCELLHPENVLPLTDYYDDSHRIRELKAMTGLTPGEIRHMAEKYNKRMVR